MQGRRYSHLEVRADRQIAAAGAAWEDPTQVVDAQPYTQWAGGLEGCKEAAASFVMSLREVLTNVATAAASSIS